MGEQSKTRLDYDPSSVISIKKGPTHAGDIHVVPRSLQMVGNKQVV
jgi:hypothetical protein